MTSATRVIFDACTPNETLLLPFDFTSRFAAGVTISSAVCTCSVWSGTDATPSSRLSGAATTAGMVATQKVTGQLAGNVYLFAMKATGSDGSVRELDGLLAVNVGGP